MQSNVNILYKQSVFCIRKSWQFKNLKIGKKIQKEQTQSTVQIDDIFYVINLPPDSNSAYRATQTDKRALQLS